MRSIFTGKIDPKTRCGFESSKEIIETYDKPVVVYPEKGNKDLFYIDYVPTEIKRINRQKYINSFAGDVGVLNVVKKLALSGEDAMDGRFKAPSGYFDATVLPKDGEAAIQLGEMKQKIWAKLDPDLKASMTFEEFASSINEEKLKAYIAKKTADLTDKKVLDKVEKQPEVKVEVKEGE